MSPERDPGRTLAEIVREILRESRALAFAIPPARLAGEAFVCALSFAASPGTAREHDAQRRAAERELLAVHSAELAWLLREAVRLRLAALADAGGAIALELRALDPDPLPFEVWQRSLREQLACSAADRVRLARSLFEILRSTHASAPRDWPPALELARASLALQPCEAGRVRLAQALLVASDAPAASVLLANLLAARPAPRCTPSVLATLALAEEACGASRRSQELRRLAAQAGEVAA